jgi:hypothetical protein
MEGSKLKTFKAKSSKQLLSDLDAIAAICSFQDDLTEEAKENPLDISSDEYELPLDPREEAKELPFDPREEAKELPADNGLLRES